MKISDLLTLTQLGTESKHNAVLQEIKTLNTSKDLIKSLIPLSHNKITDFSNTQQALQIHQNLVTQYTFGSQPTILTKRSLIDFDEDKIEKTQMESNELEKELGDSTHLNHCCQTTDTNDNPSANHNNSPTYCLLSPNLFPHTAIPIILSK